MRRTCGLGGFMIVSGGCVFLGVLEIEGPINPKPWVVSVLFVSGGGLSKCRRI